MASAVGTHFFRFQDLGEDLQAAVIEKINRPRDLAQVCLVNSQFHKLAVKQLYRHVSLEIGSAQDKRLYEMFHAGNIGIEHIKHLRLFAPDSRLPCCAPEQAAIISGFILRSLPQDMLSTFGWGSITIWPPWTPVSADVLLLLYKTQRKLKWLEVMDLDRDILPDLKKNDKLRQKLFQSPRKLSLMLENTTTLELAGFFVQNMGEVLEELSVNAKFSDFADRRRSEPHEWIETRTLWDNPIAPGLLSSTVFAHMMPFEQCQGFQNLTVLKLCSMSLRHCEDTWCRIVRFKHIRDLGLYDCVGADTLLGQLSKKANLPERLTALSFSHKDNLENEALTALDNFLPLLSDLEDLFIDLQHVRALPTVAYITRQRYLIWLSVHASPYPTSSTSISTSTEETEEHVWSTEDFRQICNSCTQLEELSCAWPATSLIRTPSNEWEAFAQASGRLRDLVTLHICNWPNTKPFSTPLHYEIYAQLLQNLAERLFRRSANDNDGPTDAADHKLHIIAFGIHDTAFENKDSSTSQLIYLRSTCVDSEGRTQKYATPIAWTLRKYVEPRSDVLTDGLHKTPTPPWKDATRRSISIRERWHQDDDDDDDE